MLTEENAKEGEDMTVHEFGRQGSPVLLLLPGTMCYWKGEGGILVEAHRQADMEFHPHRKLPFAPDAAPLSKADGRPRPL